MTLAAREMTALEFVMASDEWKEFEGGYDTVTQFLSDHDSVFSKLHSEHRHWDLFLHIAVINGRFIGYYYEHSHKEDTGWEPDDSTIHFAKQDFMVIETFNRASFVEARDDRIQFKEAPDGVTVQKFVQGSDDFKESGYKPHNWAHFLRDLDSVRNEMIYDGDHEVHYDVFVVVDGVLIRYGEGRPKDYSEGYFDPDDVSFGSCKKEVVTVWS